MTVVLIVRNLAHTIGRALESVVHGQPEVELIVLDGGSEDGTQDVIRRYEQHITFWRSAPDGSANNAINEGIARATGDVICLLAADDWIETGTLHKVVAAFSADSELDVLSCGVRIVHYEEDGGLVVDAEFAEPKKLEFNIHNIVRSPLTFGRFIRRSTYQKVGKYNDEYGASGDLDFLIRVCLCRPKTRELAQVVYNYRRHPSSRTLGEQPDNMMDMLHSILSVAAFHLKDSLLRPDERSEMRGLHGRCSARLAWMLMVRGQIHGSLVTLWQAVSHNWLWPVQVVYWFGVYLLKSKPYT